MYGKLIENMMVNQWIQGYHIFRQTNLKSWYSNRQQPDLNSKYIQQNTFNSPKKTLRKKKTNYHRKEIILLYTFKIVATCFWAPSPMVFGQLMIQSHPARRVNMATCR